MLTVEEASEFILSSNKSISKEHLDNVLTFGVFSDNLILTRFKNVIENLLDHNSELKLNEKTINKFISILRLVRKFTKEFKAELNAINSNLYVSVYQLAGKSIRRRGRIEV
ncbi:CMP/dCMP deaminase zinc-binding domain protein, partial [Escherichia coli P0304777.5]